MDYEVFRAIISERLLLFMPDLENYVTKLRKETKTAWAEMCVDHDPRDLAKACVEFRTGSEPLAAYDREKLAAKLLTMCRSYQEERRRKSESKEQINIALETRRAYGTARGGDGIEGVMALAGMLQEFRDVLAQIDVEFPAQTLDNSRERMSRAREIASKNHRN